MTDFNMTDLNSETFRTLPHDAENFGNVPNKSEGFGNIRHASERKENHTLTVREAARHFEVAGVARTERSITNWCQPNKMGIARLDCYFDPNERRYFISPESVRLAIEEEKAKATKSETTGANSSHVTVLSKQEEDREPRSFGSNRHDSEDASELRKELFDLKIANRAKDLFIDQLKIERESILGQLIRSSHTLGELETKLQLDPPRQPRE
jgi:hypothetical protein